MTACTDDERRRAAAALRKIHSGWASGTCYYAIINVLGYPDTSREDGGHALYSLLADLIEPGCDRDTPQKAAEEMFGKMRHSTKEEADVYDAMLKSKSVEIHPVDRYALLALAEEMEAGPRRERCLVAPDCSECAGHCSERLREYYARRIREVCGEVA